MKDTFQGTSVHWVSLGILLLLLGTAGCMTATIESPALKTPAVKAGVPGRRFRVESVDGKIGDREFTRDEANAALELARPDLYGADESIPLAIRLGDSTSGLEMSFNPLFVMLFWSSASVEGECEAKIYREDGKTGRSGIVPYKTVTRSSVFPWALLVSGGNGREVIFRRPGKTEETANRAMQRIVGTAMGKAIDALPDEEIRALSERVPLTNREMVRRRRLEALDVKTVHFADESGSGGTAIQHEFKPVEEPSPRKHPEVLSQEYNATRRIGKVSIDENGFGEEEAADFAARLISRICETKAVVVELGNLPSPGARYRVLRERRDEGNVHVILFEQIQ